MTRAGERIRTRERERERERERRNEILSLTMLKYENGLGRWTSLCKIKGRERGEDSESLVERGWGKREEGVKEREESGRERGERERR